MQLDDFPGQVQNRARLATPDEALRATGATLQTLGERLPGTAPGKRAAQLPGEQ